MEYLEDSLDLTFHNQRDADIGNEPFPLNDYFVDGFRRVLEIRDVTGSLPEDTQRTTLPTCSVSIDPSSP